MAVWPGERRGESSARESAVGRSLAAGLAQAEPPASPAMSPSAGPASLPPSTTQGPRSTQREARQKLDAVQAEMVAARVWLAREARDEAVRLRAAEGLNAAGGLVAPSVTVHAHVIVDPREAYADLERLLASNDAKRAGVIDVESSAG